MGIKNDFQGKWVFPVSRSCSDFYSERKPTLYRTWFTTNSRCSIGVESAEWNVPCTTVTNFCSEGKVMLLLSMVCYQVLLCFGHTRHGHNCYKQAM